MDALLLGCLGPFAWVEGQYPVIDRVLQCFVKNAMDVTDLCVTDRYPPQVGIERVKHRPVQRIHNHLPQCRQDVLVNDDLVIAAGRFLQLRGMVLKPSQHVLSKCLLCIKRFFCFYHLLL